MCVKCCKADHRAVIGRSLNGCPRQQLILHQYWKYCLARPMDQMIVTYTWPPAHHLIHCIFICTIGASIFVNKKYLLPKCAIIIYTLLLLTVLLGVKISKTSEHCIFIDSSLAEFRHILPLWYATQCSLLLVKLTLLVCLTCPTPIINLASCPA